MWICVSVCEYLVIWCDKTTVHEIIDCGSRKYKKKSVLEHYQRIPETRIWKLLYERKLGGGGHDARYVV
jgi:hypothetical protein